MDQKTHVALGDIVDGLHALGIQPGDTMMAHSSLSAFGWVEGGADTVIDACIEAASPGGTVAMPALCQKIAEKRFELWDPKVCKSDVGRITDTFWRRPEALRSSHPTHSVAATGPQAEFITASHLCAHSRPGPWGPAAFGVGCPWEKLLEIDAWYVFFGVTFRVNTTRHYVQALLVEGSLLNLGWSPGTQKGVPWEFERRLAGWFHPGVWPHYDGEQMEKRLAEMGLVTYAQIGDALCRAIPIRVMVQSIMKILLAEPEQWFDEKFMAWLRDAQQA